MKLETELKKRLLEALKLTAPEIGKDYMYERCVNKYVNAMLPAISAAMGQNNKSNALMPGQFLFSQSKVREEIGTIGKQQQYIYQLMKSDQSTSLLLVKSKGFNKNGVSKLSTVMLNPTYKELIMEELLNLRIEANEKLMAEIEANANYKVNVDPVSLASFIEKTTTTLRETGNGTTYNEALLRNLTAAKQLQSMIHKADDENPTPYINERWEMADCGRIYGQGYSLQRMAKEVRHAALGVCHKYDFKACAFAIMAGLAYAINPAIRIGATLEYIKDRQKIRERIAKELGIDKELVKTIFTSLGFGAELKNNQHNAIRGALAAAARMQHDPTVRLPRDVYNNLGADEFKRLVENRTFGYIYEELQQINTTIIDFFKTHELAFENATYYEINPKTGKKRNERQKLAWIYQALEAMAMKQFYKFAEQEPLLTTHDCLYFKQKLPSSVVADVTIKLQDTFPLLRFEHEPIYPIAEQDQFEARFADAIQFEQEHKQRIAEQEELAKFHIAANVQRAQLAKLDATPISCSA